MRTWMAIVMSLSAGLAASDAPKPTRLMFKQAGFSIEALESHSMEAPYVPVIMTVPGIDGFAANINVLIQPDSATMDQYIAKTKRDMEAMGVQIVREVRRAPDEVRFEFTGRQQGRSLHWYSRNVRSNGMFYVITATCPEEQWSMSSRKLRACTDSFKLEQAPTTAASAPAR